MAGINAKVAFTPHGPDTALLGAIADDSTHGKNLLLIQDRRIAVSCTVGVIRLFDHYQFRVNQLAAAGVNKKLLLATPPKPGEAPRWQEYFTAGTVKSRDRLLFA